MHLFMDNIEVPQRRIVCPPPDALEASCQLLGLPFRHHKAAGIFAVYPPLLGRKILIGCFSAEDETTGSLHGQFLTGLRLLERLLWLSGAEVTLAEPTKVSQNVSGKKDGPIYWDLALFVYSGQAVPGNIYPLALHSWWHRPFRSWRLAKCLGRRNEPLDGFERCSACRMAGGLKGWFLRAMGKSRAPSVLLSVPLVDGHIEYFLDSLPVIVCDGVLSYFKKSGSSARMASYLGFSYAAEPSGISKETDSPVVPEPAGAPSGHDEPGFEDAVSKKVVTETKIPEDAVFRTAVLEEDMSEDITFQGGFPERSDTPNGSSAEISGRQEGGVRPGIPAASQNVPHHFLPAQEVSQGHVEQMNEWRQLLLEAPEIARARSREVLLNRRINPTEELVDEYLEYLKRMLLAPGGDES